MDRSSVSLEKRADIVKTTHEQLASHLRDAYKESSLYWIARALRDYISHVERVAGLLHGLQEMDEATKE